MASRQKRQLVARALRPTIERFVLRAVLFAAWCYVLMSRSDWGCSYIRLTLLAVLFIPYMISFKAIKRAWKSLLYLPHHISLIGKKLPDHPIELKSLKEYTDEFPLIKAHKLHNNDTFLICTEEGRMLWSGFMDVIMRAYQNGSSWAGSFGLDHLRMNGSGCQIEMFPCHVSSHKNLLLDLAQIAKLLIVYYSDSNGELPPYLEELYKSMITPRPIQISTPDKAEKFLKFLKSHMALRSPRKRALFINEIFQAYKAMGSIEKATFDAAINLSTVCNLDWRLAVRQNVLLKKVLYYGQHGSQMAYYNSAIDIFRFLRNFNQHGADTDSSGIQRVFNMEDLDFVAMELFAPSVAELVSFLVTELNMSGLLEYAWRNFNVI